MLQLLLFEEDWNHTALKDICSVVETLNSIVCNARDAFLILDKIPIISYYDKIFAMTFEYRLNSEFNMLWLKPYYPIDILTNIAARSSHLNKQCET